MFVRLFETCLFFVNNCLLRLFIFLEEIVLLCYCLRFVIYNCLMRLFDVNVCDYLIIV